MALHNRAARNERARPAARLSRASASGRPVDRRARYNSSVADDPSLTIRWFEQWRKTGEALSELKRQELARMSEAEGLEIAEQVLSLFDPADAASRNNSSGLVDQQAFFAGLRTR